MNFFYRIVFLAKVFLFLFVDAKSTSKKRLKTFEINLDEEPASRWHDVATHFRTEAKVLLSTLKPLVGGNTANLMVAAVNTSIPSDYRDEMKGIASVLDVPYEEVLLANVYYEVSGIGKNVSLFERACTSIVAQNTNGSIFLARNQDYPPPFELVEFHAVFKRNDEIAFQGMEFSFFFPFFFSSEVATNLIRYGICRNDWIGNCYGSNVVRFYQCETL